MKQSATLSFAAQENVHTSPNSNGSFPKIIEEFDRLWETDRGQSRLRMDELAVIIESLNDIARAAVGDVD